jgi:hypothetical protein
MLVDMCGDLPEGFRNMRDRRESYNRPVMMKRNEMGICNVESKNGRRERTYMGTDNRWGLFSQGQKGQSC